MHSCRTPVFTTASMQKRQLLGSPVTAVPTPQRTDINQGVPQIEKESRERSFFPPLQTDQKISLGENLNISQRFGARVRSAEPLPLSLSAEHLVRCRSISVLFKQLNYCWSSAHGVRAYRKIPPLLDGFQECSDTDLLHQYNWSHQNIYFNCLLKDASVASCEFFENLSESGTDPRKRREQLSGQNGTFKSLQMLLYFKNQILVAVNINILLAILLFLFTIYLQLEAFLMECSLKNIWDSRQGYKEE